jgi:hypothetical protein
VSGRRYYAFLRAINTGDRRLTNAQLVAPFHELGYVDVAAYQAAGNVTFRCNDPEAVDEQRIEAAPVEGVSTSAVPVGRIEALLGEMTMRTLGTVTRMFAKFEH